MSSQISYKANRSP